MPNLIFYLLLLFSLVNCSTFLMGSRPAVNQNIPKVDKEISYELIGWKDKENKIKATEILKTLNRSDKFKSISHFEKSDSEWKIQIILDESPQLAILLGEPVQPVSWVAEKRPGRYTLYILNRILSAATRLIIPVFQVKEEIITFRIWKNNIKKAEYSYPVETVRAIGWVSLVLTFFDDAKEIKTIYSNYALSFLNDSEKNYE